MPCCFDKQRLARHTSFYTVRLTGLLCLKDKVQSNIVLNAYGAELVCISQTPAGPIWPARLQRGDVALPGNPTACRVVHASTCVYYPPACKVNA